MEGNKQRGLPCLMASNTTNASDITKKTSSDTNCPLSQQPGPVYRLFCAANDSCSADGPLWKPRRVVLLAGLVSLNPDLLNTIQKMKPDQINRVKGVA